MSEDVSRETPPPGAAALFGDGWAGAQQYAELLSTIGVERGLIGPRERPRLWSRHLLNGVAIAPAFRHGSSVCDVGTGAGLPGIVVALARPDLTVTLLEPLLRRVVFLHEVVDQLVLDNVHVLRGRAEDQERGQFDGVMARAVAPLDRLARWCLPLCRPGGTLVAMKGANAEDELEACVPVLRKLGARSWGVHEFGTSTGVGQALAVEVVAGETGSAATTQGRAS